MKFNSSELLAIGDCIAIRIDELETPKKIQSKLKEF